MFEDILELEGIIPTAITYVAVTIMMWFVFNYWESSEMPLGWIKRIMFQIILLPLTYVIINFYKNKE